MLMAHDESNSVLSVGRGKNAPPAQKLPCEGTLVGGFFPELTWFSSCCLANDRSCAGCGFWADGKCKECAPGFAKQRGTCLLCDDVPGWEDDNGMTCSDYERLGNCTEGQNLGDDLPFKGLRASQACCACGGGDRSPTPWRYPINNEVLVFGQTVGKQGIPFPGTAPRHEVEPDCSLEPLGLSLESNGTVAGTIPAYQEGETGLSASCTVTAVQDGLRGLQADAELRVSVQAMSYGAKVIVIRFPTPTPMPAGQLQWTVKMADGLNLAAPVAFEANCVPSAPWLKVDAATGTLSYVVSPHQHGGGLSGETSGFESTQCLVEARGANGKTVRSGFVAMKVFLWSGGYYPQMVFARKNRPIANMQLWRHPPEGFEAHFEEGSGRVFWVQKGSNLEIKVPPAARPGVEGVKCLGAPPESPVKWSKRTGLVTVGGQAAFVVDPRTGDVSGVSQVNLPARLGRGSMTLTCAVALGGELYDYTLTVPLTVQLEDDTCWFEDSIAGTVWAITAPESSKSCALQCQARPDCGMYWLGDNNSCIVQTSDSQGAGLIPVNPLVRTRCEEGVSCLQLKSDDGSPSASYLEGKYCPKVRQMINKCFRPTFRQSEVLKCSTPGYIMYSMRAKKKRFTYGKNAKDGHFVCVYVTGLQWFAAGGEEFTPEATDVLVAAVDPMANTVTSLEGTADVFQGMRMGFARGDISFVAQGPSTTAVTGKGFQAWECGDVSTALFSRDGINPWDELYMARGPCPIAGKGGNWVLRRVNDTDYMNPTEGSVELRGEVLACVDLDIEREAFSKGVGNSTFWMSPDAFTQDYYKPKSYQNSKSMLSISATLVADTCPPPELEESNFLVGTTDDADYYSLGACECFSEEYRSESVVSDESKKAVTRDINRPFNEFHPEPQLLVEGPYTCEDGSVLQNGQINEVSEEQCSSECHGHDECRYFSYVPQLRYCTLHGACERLGHTGLDITHFIYGIFDYSKTWCRIADPEACWASRHRRALLAGKLQNKDQPCAFQSVIAQCDLLQMVTTESHGTCKKCEYYPTTSEPAAGLAKKPLPPSFPGGAQIMVACGKDAGLMSIVSREKLDSAVLTCVGGKWADMFGGEGLKQLTCVEPVQVSQPNFNRMLTDSVPEVYFMEMRRVQYHHGVVSSGCSVATESTAAPLRVLAGRMPCLGLLGEQEEWQAANEPSPAPPPPPTPAPPVFPEEEGPVTIISLAQNGSYVKRRLASFLQKRAREDDDRFRGNKQCFSTWYLTADGKLRETYTGVCISKDARVDPECKDVWHMDALNRLRTGNICLAHGGVNGKRAWGKKCSTGRSPPKIEQWFFDGGDCRYSMKMRGSDRPLTWRYELHGGAILGSQTKASDSGSSAKDLMDPMAYGTCKTNLRGSLDNEDKNMRSVNSALRPYIEELRGVRGMVFTMEDRTLFTCSPGGEDGAELIAQYQEQVNKKRDEEIPQVRRECGPVTMKSAGCKTESADGKSWSIPAKKNQFINYIKLSPSRRGSSIDRTTKVCYKSLKFEGLRWGSTRWVSMKDHSSVSGMCRDGEVLTGMKSEYKEHRKPDSRRRRRGLGRRRRAKYWGERAYTVSCTKMSGYNSYASVWGDKHENEFMNRLEASGSSSAAAGKIFVGMAASGIAGDPKDRKYRTYTLDICSTKYDVIRKKKDEIKAFQKKIKAISRKVVSCAKEIELPVTSIPEIDITYSSSLRKAALDLDVRCHLLHRGQDEKEQQEDYTLIANQFTEIARAASYHAVGGGDFHERPFSGVGGIQQSQSVGWFTLIDNGATVWGISCEPGSVVAVHGEVTSPHCVSVGAGVLQNDLVLSSVVPGSGQCELGYAIAAWYNLPGTPVSGASSRTGGPEAPIGYKITCREVPGLSRLCEEKESRCEKDEVVTGISYELGLTVKYRCCKLPKNIGFVFSDDALHGAKHWEGYYCPTRLDETGRPEYESCDSLGSDKAEAPAGFWKLVPRATAMTTGLQPGNWTLHNVACKGDEVLNQFRMQQTGHISLNMLRASYTCMKLPHAVKGFNFGLHNIGCANYTSKPFKANSVKDFFTKSPKLECSRNRVMGRFQMRRDGDQYVYDFLCCRVVIAEPLQVRVVLTSAVKAGGDLAPLATANAACRPHEAISYMHARSEGSKRRFAIKCLALKPPFVSQAQHSLTWDKFEGLWKLWDGFQWKEPTAAIASSAELPSEASHEAPPRLRIEPAGYRGSDFPAFYIDGIRVVHKGKSDWHVVVLQHGARKVDQAFQIEGEFNNAQVKRFRWFTRTYFKPGRVVLLSFTDDQIKAMAGLDWFQLGRLGCTYHRGQMPAGGYSVAGIANIQLIVEASSGTALEAEVPQLSVAPIVDFTAAFVMAVPKPDPFPKHKPLKPKLLHFSPKKPEYDQFCDLKTRNEKMAGIDCEGDPDSCPEDEHPCAHTYQNRITEQVFWGCQQRDIDRAYLVGTADANEMKLDAEGARMDFIFDMVEAGVSLAAAALGAIPWGSFAVPAEEGAETAVEGTETAAEKVGTKIFADVVKKAMKSSANEIKKKAKSTLKDRVVGAVKDSFDAGAVLEWTGGAIRSGMAMNDGALGGIGLKGDVEKKEGAYASGKDANGDPMMLNDETPAIPEVLPPDQYGFNQAENAKNFETAGWLDCNPVQYGLSKMMCDLYCIEDAVKEGDSVILQNMKTSHTILMTNIERLLDYHTQTLLWGMGQLRDQLLDAGTAKNLLFFPGEADQQALKQGKLPDDITDVLSQLNTLPQLLHLDFSANSSLAPGAATWHKEASQQLVASLHHTLEQELKPGGNVKAAAQKAKELVQQFKSQSVLEFGNSKAQHVPHMAKMTQDKAMALRRQLRSSKDLLDFATPMMPPVKTSEGQDPAVMSWYAQVTGGFVSAHEQHASFVQTRQRALQAAEMAVEAAEGYVSCGEQDMKELHGLWQKAYRLEDQAVKDLLSAWAATTSAQERLSIAVQEGLVDSLADKAPLLVEEAGPCDTLSAVAERGYALAAKSLDKALLPLLEQVLALEQLANLQEKELNAKALSHVRRLPMNSTILALYAAAKNGVNPESAAGRRLAARALNAFGPAACPAPAGCRLGGMLLLNNSNATPSFLWTSASPGDLILGKTPAQVAHACSTAEFSAFFKEMDARMASVSSSLKSAPKQVLQQVSSNGAIQSVLSVFMNGMSAMAEQLKELKEMDVKLTGEVEQIGAKVEQIGTKVNAESHLCQSGCAERLQLRLSKKKSIVGQIIQRLR